MVTYSCYDADRYFQMNDETMHKEFCSHSSLALRRRGFKQNANKIDREKATKTKMTAKGNNNKTAQQQRQKRQ